MQTFFDVEVHRNLLGQGLVGLQIVTTSFVFVALLFRHDSIRLPSLFRLSALLVVISIVLPIFAQPLLAPWLNQAGDVETWALLHLPHSFAAALFGLGLLGALFSLGRPRPAREVETPVAVVETSQSRPSETRADKASRSGPGVASAKESAGPLPHPLDR